MCVRGAVGGCGGAVGGGVGVRGRVCLVFWWVGVWRRVVVEGSLCVVGVIRV